MSTNNAQSKERTDRQQQVLNEIRPKGFFLDPSGEPCVCGAAHIQTTKRRGFSDSLIFKHRCTACGNRFSTYIEG